MITGVVRLTFINFRLTVQSCPPPKADARISHLKTLAGGIIITRFSKTIIDGKICWVALEKRCQVVFLCPYVITNRTIL